VIIPLIAAALAAPPTTIRHQGRLTDVLGLPVNDTVTMQVTLHRHATNDDAAWSESETDVIVADGYFSIVLGDTVPFTEGLFEQPLWVEVAVGSTTLDPREPIAAVPVALTTSIDPLSSLCDRMTRVGPAVTYGTVNAVLDNDNAGTALCGSGRHVCNAAEFQTYNILGQCDPGDGWLVGGFSNVEPHRRALWNYQDGTNCAAGRYPVGFGLWNGIYAGRIHCYNGSDTFEVMCCETQ